MKNCVYNKNWISHHLSRLIKREEMRSFYVINFQVCTTTTYILNGWMVRLLPSHLSYLFKLIFMCVYILRNQIVDGKSHFLADIFTSETMQMAAGLASDKSLPQIKTFWLFFFRFFSAFFAADKRKEKHKNINQQQ